MILVDANLLIYAFFNTHPDHVRSRDWLDGQFSDGMRVGLPWISLLAFLRITTNRRLYPRGPSIEVAWAQAQDWLSQPSAWIPEPTEHHAEILASVLIETPASGDLVTDAHLAALAIEHDLTLCSNDGDFEKFAKVRWFNPLAA